MSPLPVPIDLILARVCVAACDAAYDTDPQERAVALASAGITELAYLQGENSARALVCTKDGQNYLAFQGTQVTAIDIDSIAENFKGAPVDIGDGRQVHAGYWQQLQDLVPSILPAIAGRSCIVTGHSMGGAVAHLTLATALTDHAQAIVSFGAPKAANAAYWLGVDTSRVTRLVNERDFAPVWPLLPQEWVQMERGEFWLHNGGMEWLPGADSRPVATDSVTDHLVPAYAAALGVTLV